MSDTVHLQCAECKNKNYSTSRNKKAHTEKIKRNKYCKFCRQHTLHKEIK